MSIHSLMIFHGSYVSNHCLRLWTCSPTDSGSHPSVSRINPFNSQWDAVFLGQKQYVFLSCVSSLQLPWKGRGVYRAVPRHAVYCGLAPAGLCVVLWETAGVQRSACSRKQSESLPGAHDQSVTQHQEQSPGAHRTPGGTRCVCIR